MMRWFELAEMTSPEFAAVKSSIRVALIPVGATEQHGPNSALSTDYAIAQRLCERLAEKLHPNAVVVPPIPFGISHHHMGFPGTITLSAETFIGLVFDIARSLKGNGIERLLFVNGHNGNTAILNVATTKIRYELGVEAATAFWFQQASDRVKAHARTKRFGHACEVETSVLLALAPELVRRDALEAGDMIDSPRRLAFNNEPFFLQLPIPFHEQTRNGVFGDARLATAEAGEDIVGAALERMADFVRAWSASDLQRPGEPGSGREAAVPARL
jgi:creatinine amidohydrolase